MCSSYHEKIQESLYLLREYSDEESVVSFSGGRDSLIALDLADRVGINKVVHCNTTLELNETTKYIQKIRDFYGIDIDIVYPKKTFFEYLKALGAPSKQTKWCCTVLKFVPLAGYVRRNDVSHLITGVRREESEKRSKYHFIDRNPLIPATQINPLLSWSKEDIDRYFKEFSLPLNPSYELGLKRVTCWSCPFMKKEEWKAIQRSHPELPKKLKHHLIRHFKRFNIGIRDPREFVEERKWTTYSSPRTQMLRVFILPKDEMINIRIFNQEDTEQILQLLPILEGEYDLKGNLITLPSPEKINLQRLKILIEKALNCVGCKACFSLCEHDALKLEEETISVEPKACTHCGKCLRAKFIKSACMARTAKPLRKAAIILKDKKQNIRLREGDLRIVTRFPVKSFIERIFDSYYVGGYQRINGKIQLSLPFREIKITVLPKGEKTIEVFFHSLSEKKNGKANESLLPKVNEIREEIY